MTAKVDTVKIARKAGVTRATVYQFLNRKLRNQQICDRLRAIGAKPYKPYEFLKPDRS